MLLFDQLPKVMEISAVASSMYVLYVLVLLPLPHVEELAGKTRSMR